MKYLTVRDSSILTGKSESTIKRMIREVVRAPAHADRRAIQPSAAEFQQKKNAGEAYSWRVEKEFLLSKFPASQSSSSRNERQETVASSLGVMQEYLASKERQIQTLEVQMDRKDRQIENLQERMRESNVLMKSLQERLAVLPPATEGHERVASGSPRLRWPLPFRLFRKPPVDS